MKKNKLSSVPESDRLLCLCCRGKVTCSRVCGCRVSSSVPSSPSSLFVEKKPCTIPRLVKKLSFCAVYWPIPEVPQFLSDVATDRHAVSSVSGVAEHTTVATCTFPSTAIFSGGCN